MVESDSERSFAAKLKDAEEYKALVLAELKKRESVKAGIEERLAEIRRISETLKPYNLVKSGDVAAIRTLAESRRENARALVREEKLLKEIEGDISMAYDRLEMANQELAELYEEQKAS